MMQHTSAISHVCQVQLLRMGRAELVHKQVLFMSCTALKVVEQTAVLSTHALILGPFVPHFEQILNPLYHILNTS